MLHVASSAPPAWDWRSPRVSRERDRKSQPRPPSLPNSHAVALPIPPSAARHDDRLTSKQARSERNIPRLQLLFVSPNCKFTVMWTSLFGCTGGVDRLPLRFYFPLAELIIRACDMHNDVEPLMLRPALDACRMSSEPQLPRGLRAPASNCLDTRNSGRCEAAPSAPPGATSQRRIQSPPMYFQLPFLTVTRRAPCRRCHRDLSANSSEPPASPPDF